MANQKALWEAVYAAKNPAELSWFQEYPRTSLALIEAAGTGKSEPIIDVGGGDSTLVDHLLDAGYEDITVLDISAAALRRARGRLGDRAGRVRWLEADITEVELAHLGFALWHDRAAFHFLTDAAERHRYVRAARRALRPGGHIIVATFGPGGPPRCSGLDVVRYDAAALYRELGAGFLPVRSESEAHRTPSGASQAFVYCCCRKT